jgi:hypothetical protein
LESSGIPKVPNIVTALNTSNKNNLRVLAFNKTKGVEVMRNFLLNPEATSLLDFISFLKNCNLSSLTLKCSSFLNAEAMTSSAK